MAAVTNQQGSNDLINIAASPSNGYTSIQLTLPQAADLSTIHVVLNGKDITTRVVQMACPQALCMSGTISEVDGLHSGKNVVYATAKSNSGNGLMSGRTRFSSDGVASTLASHGMLRSAAQLGTVPVSGPSGFLPPTVSFQIYYGVGVQIGANTYNITCTDSPYTLFVFDRQTLDQIPNRGGCIGSGSALASSLGQLTTTNPGALTVVTAYSSADSTLDTSLMGGTDHTKDSHAVKQYVAIGAVGAAPGSAYENFNLQVSSTDPQFYTPMSPFATGVVQEDANGNYNFDSSDVIEYTINGSPADTATSPMPITIGAFQAQMQQTPGLKGFKFTAPDVNSARGGYWLLVVQRDSPWAPIKSLGRCNRGTSPGPDGMILIADCGGVYFTGDTTDSTGQTRQNEYNKLTAALKAVGPYDLAFLTKWGAPTCCVNQWGVVGNGTDKTNGFFEFGDALQSLGGSGRAVLFANDYNDQGFAFISSLYAGDTLVGNAAISSTTYSASGQAGYLHGTLARNLNGLFQPYQSSQQLSAEDDQAAGPDYTLTKLSTLQPVPWPSNEIQLPVSDTLSGQQGAYSYISYTLITQYYIKGASGPHLDDIHYFFTGSNSNYINYHYFDAANLPWPGGASTSYTWNDPVTQQSVAFSQNDFKAVTAQVSTEVLYLSNVVNFMLTGPVNMKDMIASGNANAGLALTGAAASVLSSSLKETVASTTPVKVNVSNILSLLSGMASVASAIAGFPEFENLDKQAMFDIANLTTGILGGALGSGGAIAGGLSTNGRTTTPSRYISFTTTIGQLANSDLQGQLGIGFDVSVDSILADWGKLSILGPKITDTSNAAFYSPNQVAQNAALKILTQASERSFYMSLVPTVYSVDFWPKFYGSGSDDPSSNPPDMGIYNKSNSTCNPLYTVPAAPYSYEWTATPGGYQLPVSPLGVGWNFWANGGSNDTPADYYVLRGAVTRVASNNVKIAPMDQGLAQELFSPSGLNIPFDLFVTPYGPMSGHVIDMSEWDPNKDRDQVINEITGYASTDMAACTRNGNRPPGATTDPPSDLMSTTTILSLPASSVLGETLTLKASVTTTNGPVTTGSVDFMEGATKVGTSELDATGAASVTLDAPSLGQHLYQASYIRVAPYYASDSDIGSVTVFANSPELSLSLSLPNLNVSYGTASAAVAVQIASKYGATGPVSFGCSGLPIGMTCNFSPAQMSLTLGGTASTTLTITSSTVSASNTRVAGIGLAVFLPLSFFSLLRDRNRRRRRMQMICFGIAALAIGSLSGCSRGGASSSSYPAQETGIKTVLVTATSGTASKSIPLVVNIQ